VPSPAIHQKPTAQYEDTGSLSDFTDGSVSEHGEYWEDNSDAGSDPYSNHNLDDRSFEHNDKENLLIAHQKSIADMEEAHEKGKNRERNDRLPSEKELEIGRRKKLDELQESERKNKAVISELEKQLAALTEANASNQLTEVKQKQLRQLQEILIEEIKKLALRHVAVINFLQQPPDIRNQKYLQDARKSRGQVNNLERQYTDAQPDNTAPRQDSFSNTKQDEDANNLPHGATIHAGPTSQARTPASSGQNSDTEPRGALRADAAADAAAKKSGPGPALAPAMQSPSSIQTLPALQRPSSIQTPQADPAAHGAAAGDVQCSQQSLKNPPSQPPPRPVPPSVVSPAPTSHKPAVQRQADVPAARNSHASVPATQPAGLGHRGKNLRDYPLKKHY